MLKLFKLLTACIFLTSVSAHANHDVKVGSIKIEDPYTRATVAGQKVGGAFLKIENKGAADKLVAASSPVAKEVQLHSMSMEGNVMKMRELKVIDVPANSEVKLQPGGLHIMLIDIKAPLKKGDTVPVKLKFEKAGEVEVKFHVKDERPAHGEPGHDHSKDHQ